MLRPLNGTCHQLREKHDKKAIIAKMSFGLLGPFVNLYYVTDALETVKGKAHGQQYIQYMGGIIPMKEPGSRGDGMVEETQIFEKK
jgi:hypothetical protein